MCTAHPIVPLRLISIPTGASRPPKKIKTEGQLRTTPAHPVFIIIIIIIIIITISLSQRLFQHPPPPPRYLPIWNRQRHPPQLLFCLALQVVCQNRQSVLHPLLVLISGLETSERGEGRVRHQIVPLPRRQVAQVCSADLYFCFRVRMRTLKLPLHTGAATSAGRPTQRRKQ